MRNDIEPVSAACPVCEHASPLDVLRVSDVPVFCNVPQPSYSSALEAPLGDIDLVHCGECGHLFNSAFDPSRVEYSPGYENALEHSPTFRKYARWRAEHLVEGYGIRGKHIVELACGSGEFLRLLCELGDNRGVGFDPSLRHTEQSADGRIEFVADYYNERSRKNTADLVSCRHALEHVSTPRDLLGMAMHACNFDPSAIVYFEVPNSLYTIRDLGIWDLIYEHYSYFCGASLAHLFENSGYEVLAVDEAFGDQFLGVVARPRARDTSSVASGCGHGRIDAFQAEAFASQFSAKIGDWMRRLDQFRRNQLRVVAWGGGSKGVTFLNILRTGDVISSVVDANPCKTGMYVPGTGQQFISPDDLVDHRPDVVVVMNPQYRTEISTSLQAMGLNCEILVA